MNTASMNGNGNGNGNHNGSRGRLPSTKRRMFLSLVLSSIALTLGGFLFYQQEAADIRRKTLSDMAVIGRTKVDEILRWRKERLNDIVQLTKGPLMQRAVSQWLRDPNDPQLKQALQERLRLELENGVYFQSFLVDPKLNILISGAPGPLEKENESWQAVKDALAGTEPVASDFHESASGRIHIDLAMALRDEAGSPFAAVVLTVDAKEFLFPMIQPWPTHSHTAETLLVRRDGNDVVFMNELRHKKNTALRLRYPLTTESLPAAQAVLGRTGIFLGKDYRGKSVTSDLTPVPGTGWFLVAKEDTDEMLKNLRRHAAVVAVLVLVMILCVVSAGAYTYQAQQSRERARVARIIENEKRFSDAVINGLPGIFYLFDDQGRFLRWNKNFEDVTGYSPEEFSRLHPLDLFTGADKDHIASRIREVFAQGSSTAEASLVYKNGQKVPYYFTGLRILLNGRPCLVGMGLDISERKQAEDSLTQSEAMLNEAQRVARMGHYVFDAASGSWTSSPGLNQVFGIEETHKKNVESWVGVIHPDQRNEMMAYLTEYVLKMGNPFDREYRIVRVNDGEVRWVHGLGKLEFDEAGRVVRMFGTIQDITAYKEASAAAERESGFRNAIIDRAAEGLCVCHEITAAPYVQFTVWNQRMTEITGYSMDDINQSGWYQSVYPDLQYRAKAAARMERMWVGEDLVGEEWVITRKDGEKRTLLISTTMLSGFPGQPIVLGLMHDITDRKKAEDAVRQATKDWQATFDTINSAVWLLDKDQRILRSNKAAESFFGGSVEKMLGRHCWEIVHGTTQPLPDCPVVRAQKSLQREMFALASGGKWYEVVVHPILDGAGEYSGAVHVITDITERKCDENARTLNAQRVSALLRLNQMSGATLKEITDFVLEEAVKLTQSKIGYLAFLNEDESVLTMHSWSRSAMKECAISDKPIHYPVVTTGLWGEAVRQRKPVITNDYAADNPMKKGCPQGHVQVKRHMNTPIFDKGRIVIVAGVGNKTEEYDQSDVEQLTLLMEGMWRMLERNRAEESLRKVGALYKAIFDSTYQFIGLMTPDGTLIQANKTALDFIGYKPEDVINRPFLETPWWKHSEEMRAKVRDACERAAKGEFVRCEATVAGTEGRVLDIDFSVKPVRDENGAIIYLIPEGRDMAERKKAEAALRESEERFRGVYETAPLAFVLWDKACLVTDWNRKAEVIFGWKREEVLGRNFFEFLIPALDRPAIESVVALLLQNKLPNNSVNRNITKDGRTLICEWNNSVLRDSKGEVAGVLSLALDITERVRAEELVRENRRQLREIIDAVPHMIFVKDAEGRFLLVNQAVSHMYGKDVESLIGLKRQDIHAVKEEAEEFAKRNRAVLADGCVKIAPNEKFTDADGKVHTLQTIRAPFKMTGIEGSVVLGVSVDVTEQRKAEAFRNEIIGTVSHELRTPLSIEKEGIKLVLDDSRYALSGEQRDILETVLRNINRLSSMIDSLLDISRIEAGKMELTRTPTDLGRIVYDIANEYKIKAMAKNILVEDPAADRKVMVCADGGRIGQVVSNLLDNSLKFTEKGKITVDLKVFEHSVECSVSDTGIGIAPENVNKIFEKFQQFARVVGPGQKGLGLGLPIAREIVEKHGGRIWAKSELGKGTQVTFSLPLYKERGPER